MNRKPRAVSILPLCSCILVLGGCNREDKNKADNDKSSGEIKAINEGEYSALLPFSVSDVGQKYAQTQTDLNDTLTIGTGLTELSKEYSPSKTYAFQGGEYLDYNTLGASVDNSGLLGRTSKRNASDSNPAVGDVFPTDNEDKKITANDALLLDVFEYDWYQNKELRGLLLALVFSDKIGTEPKEATIDSDKMKLYGEECARKLVNYPRKAKPEIGNNTPVYVALYNISSGDAMLPGAYFEETYFGFKTNAEFKAINEKWVLFPTSTAIKLDGTDVTYFDHYETSFQDFLGQDINMIGKDHFMDNELTDLRINAKLHTKSVDEVTVAVQLLGERSSIFSSNNFKITAVVEADDVDIVTITRNEGISSTVAQTLLY